MTKLASLLIAKYAVYASIYFFVLIAPFLTGLLTEEEIVSILQAQPQPITIKQLVAIIKRRLKACEENKKALKRIMRKVATVDKEGMLVLKGK